jgi:hypothetical protein
MSDNCEFAGQRHGDIQLYATCQLAGRFNAVTAL